MKIFTLGAYGFSEELFVSSLKHADPTVFVDIRRRRGVRGSQYSFANSKRLQDLLNALAIGYLHLPQFAPSPEAIQFEHDLARRAKIAQRDRYELSSEFISAYNETVLAHVDTPAFMAQLPENTTAFALFCVERVPEACHRSLLASRLAQDLGVTVEHIIPPPDAPA